MNKNQMREIIQLTLGAIHFFNYSRRQFAKLANDPKQTKIKDLAGRFDDLKWSTIDKDLLILVSNLSCYAIRISTIYEILNYKPSNEELYKRKPLNPKNICFFLRDNIAHKEPGIEDKKHYRNRQDFLDKLTIQQLYEYVRNAHIEYKKMILEFSKNYKLLQKFLNIKIKNI